MLMKKITNLLFIAIIFQSISGHALDEKKCSKMLNEGWFKKYKFGGIGNGYWQPLSQETKSAGSTTAASNSTTEGTTAVSDPGYTSNVMTSETQSTSSWGECSFISLKKMQTQQIAYIEQNAISIDREIALGDGGHIDSLIDLNLCDKNISSEFKNTLQKNFKIYSSLDTAKDKVRKIKKFIKENKVLSRACYSEYI